MATTIWTILIVVLFFSTSVFSICLLSDPIKNDYFEISCQEDDKLKLPSVTIKCEKPQPWSNFPLDQKLDLENVQVTFSECDFPRDLSLLNLTKSLNLGTIEILKFEKSQSPVTRNNVKGFRVKELEFTHESANEVSDDLLHDIVVENSFLLYYPLGWTTIPKDFFKNSPTLIYVLIAERGNITKIRRIDFAGLKNLQNLSLFSNQIDDIEAGAFDDLVNLESLDIGHNRLTTLPAELFKNLVKLESLNVYENRLTLLTANLLQIKGNNVLQNIRLNDNNLTTLPDGFFKDLNHLVKLYLERNSLVALPQDVFYNAKALEELHLQGNLLVTLPPHVFDTNTHLKELHLHNNTLESLPERIFKTIVAKNSEIHLEHNRLTNLTENVFFGIRNVKILNLSHNKLSSIGPICPNATDKNITVIDLSFNNITAKHPSLENCSIFMNCVSTQELHLKSNAIDRIFFDWQYLTFKILDLENNVLTYVDSADLESMLRRHSEMSLRNNKITTVNLEDLERRAVNFVKLNSITREGRVDLEGNPFTCDCKLISFIHYINKKLDNKVYKHLNISYENLKCSNPPEFKNTRLTEINSKDLRCLYQTNAMDDACNGSCTCYEYPDKKTLLADCSYKNLSSVPSTIGNPNNYSIELNMAGNYLSEAPKLNESYLFNVTSLDLSNNKIIKVPLETFSTSLRDLKLHNNNISKFEPEVLQYLLNDRLLRNLTVSKNKWICNCEFLKIIQNKYTPLISHHIMCHNKDKLLSDMSHNDLCESSTSIIVGGSLLVAFFGIVIGGLVALYYKYQQEIKVWLYAKQWCLWFVTADELDKNKVYDAFISFSHKDEDFVKKEIVAKLEEGPTPFKLCVHYRDWLAGEWIPVQIATSVEKSRRTIIVLSPNFIESIWGRIEFRTAHNQAMSEGRARVIVILYGDIGNTNDLDPELKTYLSMNTYVKWGDPWFWDKLKYALPHRHDSSRRRTRNARIMENHLAQLPISDNNDKAESIPMSKTSISSNDSAKLLGPDDRISASC